LANSDNGKENGPIQAATQTTPAANDKTSTTATSTVPTTSPAVLVDPLNATTSTTVNGTGDDTFLPNDNPTTPADDRGCHVNANSPADVTQSVITGSASMISPHSDLLKETTREEKTIGGEMSSEERMSREEKLTGEVNTNQSKDSDEETTREEKTIGGEMSSEERMLREEKLTGEVNTNHSKDSDEVPNSSNTPEIATADGASHITMNDNSSIGDGDNPMDISPDTSIDVSMLPDWLQVTIPHFREVSGFNKWASLISCWLNLELRLGSELVCLFEADVD